MIGLAEEFERQIVVPIMTGLQSNKMKSKAVWISCILAALFCARPANASVIMTLDQVGPNVVATASGTIDLTDLRFEGDLVGSILPIVGPTAASLRVVAFSGEVPLASLSEYTGVSGPASFGPGPGRIATLGVGDVLGILSGSIIEVPLGYVSDTPLFGTAYLGQHQPFWPRGNPGNLYLDLGIR